MIQTTRKERKGKGFESQRYDCSQKVRRTATEAQETVTDKKRKVEKQVGKGTDCGAYFSYKMYDCKSEEGVQCFDLKMKIQYDHNHEVSSTGAWNFLGVSQETKARYFQLFAEAYSPSKARLVYIAELKSKMGEAEFFKESSKRSINPGSGTVFNMWTKYCQRFGSANGPDSFLKACEEIDRINERAGEKIASIRQLPGPDGVRVVAVCDELMKRTHLLVQQSADIMFVDATGSLDRCNHQVHLSDLRSAKTISPEIYLWP